MPFRLSSGPSSTTIIMERTNSIGHGNALAHVALRRKHFIPYVTEGSFLEYLISGLMKCFRIADSLSCHHYELVVWISHLDNAIFHAGALQISFDWNSEHDKPEWIDNKLSLLSTRSPRLYRSNWFPDELPNDDDKSYRYCYVGSRRVDPTKLFSNHCVNGAFSAGFITNNISYGIQYYSLTRFCCYSAVRLIGMDILGLTIPHKFEYGAENGPWVSYDVFYKYQHKKMQSPGR